jgi:putative acetyltransferase
MSALVLRPVRPDDAAALAEMRARPAVARFIHSFPSQRLESSRQHLARLKPDNHIFVAELDGRVVGMAGLHVRPGKLRHSASLGIYVHDDFHGRGIGRALMERLIDLADRWLGLLRVDLTVHHDNAPAIALYRKLGFVVEGTRRRAIFVDGGLHDVVMMARVRE